MYVVSSMYITRRASNTTVREPSSHLGVTSGLGSDTSELKTFSLKLWYHSLCDPYVTPRAANCASSCAHQACTKRRVRQTAERAIQCLLSWHADCRDLTGMCLTLRRSFALESN